MKIALLLITAVVLEAQPLQLSMSRAVEIATSPEGNTSIQLAEEALKQARARSGEARAALLPDVEGALRYESVINGDRSVPSLRTLVANGSALIRANVKAMVEYVRDVREGQNHSLNILVRFAF